jgi:hypothetical protein
VADFDYEKFAETFERLLKSGSGAGQRIEGNSIADVVKNFGAISKTIKQTNSMWSVTNDLLQGQNREYSTLNQEVNKLYHKYKDSGTFEERKQLNEKRRELQRQVIHANTNAALVNFTNTAVKSSYELGKNFVTALQNGTNDVDAIGGVLQGGIGALTNIGRQLPGVAGVLAGAFGDLAQFGVGVLLTELKKTQEAFAKSSSAGALFADGMTGLRNSANAAGLTVQQFGAVISANRQVLAESGLSVGDAARAIGNVGRVIRTSGIQTQLMNLGFSFEEQAALTADVLSTMRRANSSYMQDPNAVARAVSDYAVNLRTIAAITGEDARKKMEEAKAASSQIAVRIRLQELEKRAPGITAAYEAAIATRSQAEQKAINQMFTLGTVTDTTMNILMSNNQGVRQGIEGFVDLLRSGNTNVQDYQVLQGRANDRFRENLSGLEALGQAGIAGASGVLGDTVRLANQKLLESDKFTEEAARNAQKAAQDQKNTNDALTTNMNNLSISMQNMRLTLEKFLTDEALPKFSGVLASMASGMEKFLNILADIPRNIEKYLYMAIGSLIGALVGTLIGAIAGLFTGPFAPIVSPLLAALGGAAGAAAGGAIGNWLAPGRASGGPVNPATTYLVGERGPELFQPNSPGNIVPNNQLSAAGPISGELVNVMREQLEQLRQLVAKSDETTAAMADIRSIQQQLLNNSY